MKIVEMTNWNGQPIVVGMKITLSDKAYIVTERISETLFMLEVDPESWK